MAEQQCVYLNHPFCLPGWIGQKFPLPLLWTKAEGIPEALSQILSLTQNPFGERYPSQSPGVQENEFMAPGIGPPKYSILLTFQSSPWVFCVPDDPMKKKARKHPGFLPGMTLVAYRPPSMLARQTRPNK
jgi:hypothetical protein